MSKTKTNELGRTQPNMTINLDEMIALGAKL